MPNVISPKEDYRVNSSAKKGKSVGTWLKAIVRTSVGAKFLVAITGAGLVLFVVGHLVGNLKIYAGQDDLNAYAVFLKEKTAGLIWVARAGLLAIFLIHIYLVITLKRRAAKARPVDYAYKRHVQSTLASRITLISGVMLLFFVLFHLSHYTLGWVKTAGVVTPSGEVVRVDYLSLKDAEGRHDVYSMVVYGFRNYAVSVGYILAMLFLFYHAVHGIKSAFQTLGANSPRWESALRNLALAVAAFLFLGNVSIASAVMAGYIEPNPDIEKTLAAHQRSLTEGGE